MLHGNCLIKKSRSCLKGQGRDEKVAKLFKLFFVDDKVSLFPSGIPRHLFIFLPPLFGMYLGKMTG